MFNLMTPEEVITFLEKENERFKRQTITHTRMWMKELTKIVNHQKLHDIAKMIHDYYNK